MNEGGDAGTRVAQGLAAGAGLAAGTGKLTAAYYTALVERWLAAAQGIVGAILATRAA